MQNTTFDVKVPGKLMIAGEYAVTEPNQASIVVAVDRYISAKITVSDRNKLTLPQLELNDVTWDITSGMVDFQEYDNRLRFIKNTFQVVYNYLHEQNMDIIPFHLAVTSELDDPSGRKYGLGSSAAIVVAVVTAMLKLHESEKEISNPEKIFKLAAIAHFKTQGNGSCADIAASTFGGWLHYTAFQADWLIEKIHKESSISDLLTVDWPMLSISSITPPKNLAFYVGWTGEAASTAPMVTKIQQFRKKNPTVYRAFLEESNRAVALIVKGFNQDNATYVLQGIKQNRHVLCHISEQADTIIETDQLRKLANIAEEYGSGKSSGAGGGDCGIAFVSDRSQVKQLKADWLEAEIKPLNLQASDQGAFVSF
ncbi:phosphomevalonate kinase [Paraliobacillus quinghaiensis]|uniref:phosphomevalonate kinase n=1 Tax=Paraliobacillus quinghaiensis TaxID=470815 RepID=A0A917TV61_9BACI|nr:phosphomevalonate kinase [Paraliobacillus quinghaiensis]GGM38864.1 phosphomevalonate kinase [Paraliobacillus quinghaiensis]